ncbi:MAG: IclR family transcriptional regulator [Novosphingobium sp.]|nr:IclR family transcriptional regulator [Novosphingobium sp.]
MSASADRQGPDERRGQSPQSVIRVIRILEALCASEGPVTLADLSRALGTPKSSLAALLRGLAEEDLVVATDGAWRLGPGAFGLGSALVEARRRFHSNDLIRDAMRRLAERSDETVLLGVEDDEGEQMTYVDVIESRNAVRFARSVGDRRPLYATAGGRALLATRSDAELTSYLEKVRVEALTPGTQTDKGVLAGLIAAARRDGVAQTIDQASDGVTGTAAVIREAGGKVLGALIVAAPSSRSQDKLAELARLVREEATAISRTLGYRATGTT